MPAKVLISGASGPIGATLLPSLTARGFSITRVVRGIASGGDQITWNPAQAISPDVVSGFQAVIHLAGESVVGRWTAAKKHRILESRMLGTRHLAEALAKAPQPPQALISASAIGYYGDRGEEILREESSPGRGFLPEVCEAWEMATRAASDAGIRAVQIRIGLVLSPDGGALQAMLTPFRMGVGGNMGNGHQWWSWIDVRDLAGAIHHIISNDSLHGPVNMVSPNPVRNAEFTKTLASVLRRPAIFPMPAFAARLVFGQMADELLLASQKVEPAKLAASGYVFEHSELRQALKEILRR